MNAGIRPGRLFVYLLLTSGILVSTLQTGCSNPEIRGFPLYAPPVVCEAVFSEPGMGGDRIQLHGNIHFPNTCTIENDTIRIMCHSNDFSEVAQIRNGYQLRLDIYPPLGGAADTLNQGTTALSLRDVLIRFSEYQVPQSTFRVSRPDTIHTNLSAHLEIRQLQRFRNGRIELVDCSAVMHREGTFSSAFEMRDGIISGTIE